MVASVLACGMPAAHAQRGLKDIPLPDPAAELAAMTVADGYEVTLFAADPMISKPLQINFDPQGRMWVSSSSIYPQIRPGEVANDTVTVLEDRDGDGRADTARVFADGLLMPTAVLPDDAGGCYVANSTELLHVADTDGDGKGDRRSVVLSGFGAEDTHHIIHTFRRGPDARFYFNQSIYIHSHVETPFGVRRLNGGGIWRFQPESLRLDVFARGWVNTWGHIFDPWGRSLATDGAGGEGIYYAFPGAAYQAAVGTSRILHGMNPGSPKYCSLERIDGRHLPEDARGLLVTNDFRANRVSRFQLAEQGSGFTSTKLPDLIHSKRVTFRPIDVKMGPDGAIYIADWYNPIIQHGEVDFRDPRRDREHGRIWRVTAKGRPTLPRIDFTKLSTTELLAQLAAPESYARDMARRTLRLRGPAILPDLARWLAAVGPQAPDVERLRLEALWLRQGLDGGSAGDVDRPLLESLLAAKDSRGRAAACRVVPDWADRLDAPAELLAKAVDDPAPQVRLEAVRALAAIGGRRAAEFALHAVDHERDEPLDYAVWLTARDLRDAWLPAVLDGTFGDDGRFGRVLYAVRAADASEAIPRIVTRVAQGGLSAEERAAALVCIAALGNPQQMRLVYDMVVNPATPAADRLPLLSSLMEAYARRRIVPAGDLAAIAGIVRGSDDAVVARGIEAVGAWDVTAAVPELATIAAADGRTRDLRKAAIAALGDLPGEPARDALLAIASAAHGDRELRAAAVAALVPRSRPQAAAQAVALLATGPDKTAAETVFRGFLGAKDGATALAEALDAASARLSADVVRHGLQAVSASGRQEPALATSLEAAAARAGGPAVSTAGSSRHAMNTAELDAFINLVRTKADRTRGEAIYARESLKCVSCHRIGDHGSRVGPNLAAIGAASQLDYLIDSLVHPAKNVKEGFNTLVVQTDDGQVVTGIQVSRSDTELVLRDATGKEVKIPRADIEAEAAGTSLMPAGLIDQLSREELADLVRFLSELGR
jgi:putative heme-binding domain-containing protein